VRRLIDISPGRLYTNCARVSRSLGQTVAGKREADVTYRKIGPKGSARLSTRLALQGTTHAARFGSYVLGESVCFIVCKELGQGLFYWRRDLILNEFVS